MYRDKLHQEREAEEQAGVGSNVLSTLALVIGGLLMSVTGFAQVAAEAAQAAPVDNTINGLSPMAFYLMVAVIAVEILILIALVFQLKFLMGIESKHAQKAAAAVEEKTKVSWWWRLNKSASVEEEKDIDLSHDYDGIRELDNKLPPWWVAAFALSILFAMVYLYRYHVSHSAPLMIEELQISMKTAEAEQSAYLAKTGGNVNESNVKMLDAAGIAKGQALFTANCTPCHGPEGQGAPVGPNLTDQYWIHGGAIADVFKTIKYGVVEKGMRSWKDDFSPVQMAQLASFVLSLQGTKPANPKEPQGVLIDGGQSSSPAADSAGAAPPAPAS
jgi:cytochrome c oxidase cbb3-type subunit III